jgi:hypothetical protein
MKTISFFMVWIGAWGLLYAVSGFSLPVLQLASILGTILYFYKFFAVYETHGSAVSSGRPSPSWCNQIGLFIITLLFFLLTMSTCGKATIVWEMLVCSSPLLFLALHVLLLWLSIYCIIRAHNTAQQVVGILGIPLTLGIFCMLVLLGHGIQTYLIGIVVAYSSLLIVVGGVTRFALRQQHRLSKQTP